MPDPLPNLPTDRPASLPAYLLDLDGTLADTLADIRESTNFMRREHGFFPLGDDVVRGLIGHGVLALLGRALPGTTVDDDLWQLWRQHHTEQCTRLVQPYPGVEACLRRWRGEGRRLAVVTNKPTEFTQRILDHLGLSEFFGAVICGDTLGEKKPSPAPLHEALRRLGVSDAPGRNIPRAHMVGDGLPDLRAAKAAGLRPVACLFGFGDPDALRAEGADEYWSAFGTPEPQGELVERSRRPRTE